MLARFAQAAGLTVTVLSASAARCMLKGDALHAYDDCSRRAARASSPSRRSCLREGEVIVDALARHRACGTPCATSSSPVIQRDQCRRPAGVRAGCAFGARCDTGVALGDAVRADCTVTLRRPEDRARSSATGRSSRAPSTSTISKSRRPPSAEFAPRLERIMEAEIVRRAAAPAARRAQGRLRPRAHRGQRRRACPAPRASRAKRACASARASSRSPSRRRTWRPSPPGRPELICLPFRGRGRAQRSHRTRADVVAVGPGLGRSAGRAQCSMPCSRAASRWSSMRMR